MKKILFIILFLSSAITANASIWYVDASSPAAQGSQDGATWPTAMDSVDQALIDSLADGDVIWINAGSYQNAAYVSLESAPDNITWRANEEGVELYTPNSGGASVNPFFKLSSSTIGNLENWKFSGINFLSSATTYGLIQRGFTTFKMDNLIFYGCTFSYGGGTFGFVAEDVTFTAGSEPTYEKCKFISCHSTINSLGADATVNNCIFINNALTTYAVTTANDPKITNCIFLNCSESVSGFSNIAIEQYNIYDNTSYVAFGSSIDATSQYEADDSTIMVELTGNQAYDAAFDFNLKSTSKAVTAAEDGSEVGSEGYYAIIIK